MEIKIIDLGCGEPFYEYFPERCWLEGGIAKTMESIYGRVTFNVIGVEPNKPRSFVNDEPCIIFQGFSLDEMAKRDDQVDAILWRYPNPQDIFDLETLQLVEKGNPVDTLRMLVRKNLTQGGLLFFETDMYLEEEVDPLVHEYIDNLDYIFPLGRKLVVQSIKDMELLDTGKEFKTNDPIWNDQRAFGRIYKKVS